MKPVRSKREWTAVTVLMVVATAWSFRLASCGAQGAASDSVRGSLAPRSVDVVAAKPEETATVARRSPATDTLLIRAIDTRKQRIKGVRVFAIPCGVRTTNRQERRALGRTDSEGEVRLSRPRLSALKTPALVFEKRTFQRGLILPPYEASAYDVMLKKGATLVVRFGVGDGRWRRRTPVSNMRVDLSETTMSAANADWRDVDTLPGSVPTASVFMARSNSKGEAVFVGLKPGRYAMSLRAEHVGYAVVGKSSGRRSVDIAEGTNQLEVELTRAYGAAVRFVGDDVVRVCRRYEPWAKRSSYQLAEYRALIQDRFPGCCISVQAARDDRLGPVALDVWTRMHGLQTVMLQHVPLEMLKKPMVVDLSKKPRSASPLPTVVFRVVDSEGDEIPEVRLFVQASNVLLSPHGGNILTPAIIGRFPQRLQERIVAANARAAKRRFNATVISGRIQSLPADEYTVGSMQRALQSIAQETYKVQAGLADQQIDVRLDDVYVPYRFSVKGLGGKTPAYARLAFSRVGGARWVQVVRTPEARNVRILLPKGTIEVRVKVVGYEEYAGTLKVTKTRTGDGRVAELGQIVNLTHAAK